MVLANAAMCNLGCCFTKHGCVMMSITTRAVGAACVIAVLIEYRPLIGTLIYLPMLLLVRASMTNPIMRREPLT
eukprot:946592-Rhodomonas_salina.1